MRSLTTDDEMAAQFYDDPRNLEPVGGAQRPPRSTARLASHVPVRFSSSTITKVKQLADEDGLTVSSWVRRLVEREADRRLSARNLTTSSGIPQAAIVEPKLPVTANRHQEAVKRVA